jgi:hypothetical protein
MPIITLQRQMRQVGRIRTGNQVVSNGKRRPAKLDTFRLTSKSRELIEAAAAAYGGTVTPWDNNGSPEFEVITTVAALDIIVPPGQAVSQWYEMWSGGGCQRRCDGVTNVLTMLPCECPADTDERLDLAKRGQACKATTRLNVILPALPDLGVWRLESHGYYAAVELMGAAEILAMATEVGHLIPARLRLEQREKRIPGQPTNRYAVPIIEFVGTRMADLALTGEAGDAPQLAAGIPSRPALPATTLPATSSFRAPAPAVDAPGPAADPEPVSASAPSDNAAATPETAADGPSSLTQAELLDWLESEGITRDHAIEVARAKWPDLARPGASLTGPQRAQLLAMLRAETPAVVGL